MWSVYFKPENFKMLSFSLNKSNVVYQQED